MTAPGSKRPFTWQDYEHGRSSPRQGSTGSASSRVHFDEPEDTADSGHVEIPQGSREDGSSGSRLHRRRYLNVAIICMQYSDQCRPAQIVHFHEDQLSRSGRRREQS